MVVPTQLAIAIRRIGTFRSVDIHASLFRA
jgi:hypothetical protein